MEKTKVKIKPDENINLMVVNKCPLKNIIKSKQLQMFINETTINVNKIVIQTYQFLKMYIIDKYGNNKNIPKIDKDFIMSIMKTITLRQDTRGKPPAEETQILLNELKIFYDNEYKKCIIGDDIISSTKLNYILAYEAIDIVKNIETHISEHFIDFVNKFVNISFDLKDQIHKINNMKLNDNEKKNERKKLYTMFKLVKNDLLKINNDYESDKKFHKWINEHRQHIITKNVFAKDSIYYDVASMPQDYLKSLIYIGKELEKLNKVRITKELKQIKLFQIIPQRTNIIPKYITIDTCALINLTIKENILNNLNNVKEHQHYLWHTNFKIQNQVFKRKNYIFNYMIKTDGVGCSVLLIKTQDGKPINITSGLQKKVQNGLKSLDKYIEDVVITNEMKQKKIVTVDPNLSDIIYCLSKTTPMETTIKNKDGKIIKHKTQDENLTFRYTQNQRRLETRKKKYDKLTQEFNNTTKIEGKTIKQIELELSKYNSKTSNYNKFVEYCKKKNEVNRKLFDHYKQFIFRKFKLNIFINTQKSESKMVRNFENKFGKSNECIIVMGDYDKKDGFKGKEPTICKKIRKIFRNHKYIVYLINEFRTSKICHKCHCENETFIERESHKPKDIDPETGKGKLIEVFGCLRCKNAKCKMIQNRDKNATLNMYNIVKNIFEGKGRPKIFCRDDKEKE